MATLMLSRRTRSHPGPPDAGAACAHRDDPDDYSCDIYRPSERFLPSISAFMGIEIMKSQD